MGSAITDAVVCTAGSSDFKGVDEYQFDEIIEVILQGADQPHTGDVLNKLMSVLNFRFRFQQKIVANVETL